MKSVRTLTAVGLALMAVAAACVQSPRQPAPGPLPAPPGRISWQQPGATSDFTVNSITGSSVYSSRGKSVPGYFYRPPQAARFPPVIVLHGRGGLGAGTRSYASWLARQGYLVLAPDYFTPVGITPEKFDVSFYQDYVDRVREDLAQGVAVLKSLPWAAPGKVGVVGFSLGGYLALLLATRDDVGCAISYYGAYAPDAPARYTLAGLASQVQAPVLMFHGDADADVPLAAAQTARSLLAGGGKRSELVVYPVAGHSFDLSGAPGFDARAAADSQQKALAFLKANLG